MKDYKIFAVDDEPEIAKIIKEFLGKNGFNITTTSDPAYMLTIIESGVAIDLLILDMKMPKIKGLDILRRMQELKRTNPVIVLTGSIDSQKYKEKLEGLGYRLDDIAFKPINLYELLDKVKYKLGIKD